jgi:hypothetical protein
MTALKHLWKIDDSIIEAMKPSLEKIYFQNHNENGNQLISEFNLPPKSRVAE